MRDGRWLFEDWPERTTMRAFQVLDTGLVRLFVIAAARPIRRLLRRLT